MNGRALSLGDSLDGTVNNPQVATVVAMHLLALGAFFFPPSVSTLGAACLLHFLTGCFGISLGYHRLITHRAFSAHPIFLYVCAFLGNLAWLGGPITWAALHRAHHRHPDELGDPHARSRGFLWSHVAWIFRVKPNGFSVQDAYRWVGDLKDDRVLRWLNRQGFALNLAVALPVLLFSPELFFWAFPLRVVLVWHTTWLINSFAHGPSETGEMRIWNRAWLAVVSYGEGMHRNHHRSPRSPHFSRRAWKDPGFVALGICHRLGWVRWNRGRY